MIYFTSDLHFCHDRNFLYEPRGFKCIEDHDKAIIENWNNLINDDDEVYILGDLMLNDNVHGIEYLNKLKGIKHTIYGNHDTDTRKELYKTVNGVVDCQYATVIKYGKYSFYLSHYPTITSNNEKRLSERLINLYGHTHQQHNFFKEDTAHIYHVGLDSHNNTPISIEDILVELKAKARACEEAND